VSESWEIQILRSNDRPRGGEISITGSIPLALGILRFLAISRIKSARRQELRILV
jgi:hypothetical protein